MRIYKCNGGEQMEVQKVVDRQFIENIPRQVQTRAKYYKQSCVAIWVPSYNHFCLMDEKGRVVYGKEANDIVKVINGYSRKQVHIR